MKKLHRALFSVLLVLLPVQLGRHFWPEFSLVFGIRVDYLSPTIYLTDLLVMSILGAWFLEKIGKLKNLRTKKLKNYLLAFLFLGFLVVNSLLSQNVGAALYKLIKIIEFALLGFYIAKNNYLPPAIRYPLSLTVIYSSFIALAQFLKQASLNGIFWWLGERTFNAFTPGIARAVWDGQLIMRPYATFPHPNVLAGFILISLILIVMGRTKETGRKIVKWLAIILGVTTILASFSRAVWLVGILILFSYFLFSKKKRPLSIPLLIIGALVFFTFVSHLAVEEAVSQRFQLNQAAIEMIKQSPITGMGLNNFIVRLPGFWPTEAVRFLQPVHNIFLLVAAETGLIGLLIFLWFLILTFKKLLITNNYLLIASLSAILALGLFDHYWLTLQQTQLLFTIVLGLSWSKAKSIRK